MNCVSFMPIRISKGRTMFAFFRRLARRFKGKHPVYEWGACSHWSPWQSVINRTLDEYVKDASEELRREMAGCHPSRIPEMLDKKGIKW